MEQYLGESVFFVDGGAEVLVRIVLAVPTVHAAVVVVAVVAVVVVWSTNKNGGCDPQSCCFWRLRGAWWHLIGLVLFHCGV